jgi:exodeoxyribonuclease V beta subunit
MPYQPPWQPEPQLQPRQFTKLTWDKWSISSFTSLNEGGGVASAHYAGDSQPDELFSMTDSQERTIASLPRGARVGSCLHLIFERLDFTLRDRSQLEALVESALFEYGIAREWVSVVATLVGRVLLTPLQQDGLRLAQVPLKQRLTELAFYYPVVELAPEGLQQILASYGMSTGLLEEQSESLGGNGVRGYLKGFIDLVFESQGRFYLVDYKSNWLGEGPAAYRTERLAEVMVREAYCTQYLLYTVALHRYLQLRLPDYDYERHFGGVFYLFLRGMDPALGSEYGVFRERPPWALVNALNDYFASGALLSGTHDNSH